MPSALFSSEFDILKLKLELADRMPEINACILYTCVGGSEDIGMYVFINAEDEDKAEHDVNGNKVVTKDPRRRSALELIR